MATHTGPQVVIDGIKVALQAYLPAKLTSLGVTAINTYYKALMPQSYIGTNEMPVIEIWARGSGQNRRSYGAPGITTHEIGIMVTIYQDANDMETLHSNLHKYVRALREVMTENPNLGVAGVASWQTFEQRYDYYGSGERGNYSLIASALIRCEAVHDETT